MFNKMMSLLRDCVSQIQIDTQAAEITGCTLRQLQYWREKGVIVPVISETGTGRSIYYSKANLVELAVMVYLLSAGLSFDLGGETLKTLKDKEPELFKSGEGKRFMLLGAVGENAAEGGTGLMLSFVEFDREKAIASIAQGLPVIPLWLDQIYQRLASKLVF